MNHSRDKAAGTQDLSDVEKPSFEPTSAADRGAEAEKETSAKVRQWAHSWFEGIYAGERNDNERGVGLGKQEEVESAISSAVGEPMTNEEGYYNRKYQKGAAIFLESLVDFISGKATDPKEAEGVRRFLGTIQESLFSWSPNISNQVGFADMLFLTSRATCVPEVQGWFGQTMVGEVVYELSFCDRSSVEHIIEQIKARPLAEVLDIIHQLQTVGGDAAAQGDWAVKGLNNSEYILEQLRKDIDSPLVGYAAELAISRIRQEEGNSTLGVVTYQGNQRGGRLDAEITSEQRAEHDRLAGQIDPDRPVGNDLLLPVAADAVGLFDHSGLPRFLSRVPLEKLGESSPISIVALRNTQEAITKEEDFSSLAAAEDVLNIIDFTTRRIIAPGTTISRNKVEGLSSAWAKISEALTPDEWKKLFAGEASYKTAENKLFNRLRRGEFEYIDQRELQRLRIGYAAPVMGQLLGNWHRIQEDLAQYLRTVETQLEEKLRPAHFASYQNLPADHEINPFTATTDKNLSLLLQHLHQPDLRARVEEDLGINFEEIPIRSQVHLLRFLAGEDNKGFDRLRTVVQEKRDISEKVLVSFLANAEDKKYGDAVLTLAERLDKRTADAVFSKYNEIAAASENARAYLYKNFRHSAQAAADENVIRQIVKNLLHRGNELLERFARREDGNPTTLLAELNAVKIEIMLFTSTFKAVRQELGPPNLNEARSVEFSIVNGQDLKKQGHILPEMRRIYRENYGDRAKYPEEFVDVLLESFDESLNDPNNTFYLLKHQGAVAAFCRFDHKYRGDKLDSIYFGSFNTNPAYQQGKIGETMIEQALLEEQARGVPIVADCNPESPITKKYIELGFIATKEYNLKGVPSFAIEMLPAANGRFASKSLTTEQIIQAAKTTEGLSEDMIATTYPAGTRPGFSLLHKGYVLTRYFEDSGKTYCVFEKAKRAAKAAETIEMAA